jgi:ABC-type Fe3+ transport system permease subunit
MDYSAAGDPEDQVHGPGHPGRYARLALIAAGVIAVVCLALLLIIFVLDAFNATVYSVGEKDISDATDEASQIRNLYDAARTGGIVVLVASLAVAAGAGFLFARSRRGGSSAGSHDGEDVGFDGLAGR